MTYPACNWRVSKWRFGLDIVRIFDGSEDVVRKMRRLVQSVIELSIVSK